MPRKEKQPRSGRKKGPDGLPSAENALGNFSQYVAMRTQRPSILNASRYVALKNQEGVETSLEEYRSRIVATAESIVNQYGINSAMFADERYSEVFFAVCDSWSGNRPEETDMTRWGSGRVLEERYFLDGLVRSLAGSFSQRTVDEVRAGEVDSSYIRGEEDKRREVEVFSNLMARRNEELTAKVKGALLDRGPESMLAKVRELASGKAEKEFDVLVVDMSVERRGQVAEERGASWESTIRGGYAFMDINPITGLPTIVVPAEYLQDCDFDTGVVTPLARLILSHEFGHTQGEDMVIGEGDLLGGMWEENRATRSVGLQTHFVSDVIFNVLGDILMSAGNTDFYTLFSRGFSSVSGQAEFLRLVSDNFGLRSMLLLMVATNSEEVTSLAIKSVPEFRTSNEVREILHAVLQGREAILPQYFEAFGERLRGMTDIQLQKLVTENRNVLRWLPEEIQDVIRDRLLALEYNPKLV